MGIMENGQLHHLSPCQLDTVVTGPLDSSLYPWVSTALIREVPLCCGQWLKQKPITGHIPGTLSHKWDMSITPLLPSLRDHHGEET